MKIEVVQPYKTLVSNEIVCTVNTLVNIRIVLSRSMVYSKEASEVTPSKKNKYIMNYEF